MGMTTTPANPPQAALTSPGNKFSLQFLETKRPGPWRRFSARAWKIALLVGGISVAGYFAWHWFMPDSLSVTEITATVARGDLPIIVSEHRDLERSKTVEGRCEGEGNQLKI